MKTLNLSLIHLNVRYKQPDENRRSLLRLVSEAAKQGANIVVAPEMAVSGYSFDNRDEIAPLAEYENGPAWSALADSARKNGVYACVGMAEIDPETGIVYNSAFVFGPEGDLVGKYRKINAEARWGCSGGPGQDNTFETPWGRVGVLICSDVYPGLMPRATALRGADLLLAPSNWPMSGLDPKEIWRARALENGIYLAACNRTGVDKVMDCRKAPSCVYDPCGKPLFEGQHEDSRIFAVQLPLGPDGRLDNSFRMRRLADRRPRHFRDCCLNLQMIRDLTTFLQLPEPDVLDLSCVVSEDGQHPADALEKHLSENEAKENGLVLLPPFDFSEAAAEKIDRTAGSHEIGILTRTFENGHRSYRLFEPGKEIRQWPAPTWPSGNGDVFPVVDYGPARLFLAPFAAMAHPEMAVVAAKRGCDLALCIEDGLSPEQRLLAGVRTVENLTTAVCSTEGAGIWSSQEGHQRWSESLANPGDACRAALDTNRTRAKKFQDNIDFSLLLSTGNSRHIEG